MGYYQTSANGTPGALARRLRRCPLKRMDTSSPREFDTIFFAGFPSAAGRFFPAGDPQASEHLIDQRIEGFFVVLDEKHVPLPDGCENCQGEFCLADQSILRSSSGEPFAVVQDDPHSLSSLVHEGHTIGV